MKRLIWMLVLALASSAQAAVLTISTDGDNLAYDKKTLHVKPGESVTLTFKNAASSGSSMEHSWVLVKPGAQDQVSAEAPPAGKAKDYIPDDPNILAHTKLLKSGQSQTIKFKAPIQPGKYPYFCSFPGHAQLLKGVLEVG
jgi:azurin